jgi:membrane protease YdiL (CAAX protease family)
LYLSQISILLVVKAKLEVVKKVQKCLDFNLFTLDLAAKINCMYNPIRILHQLHSWWLQQSTLPFILTSTLLSFLVKLPLLPLMNRVGEEKVIGDSPLKELDPFSILFIGVVIAPMIETLLTQSWPIRLLHYLLPRQQFWLPMLVSAILFSGLHFGYSIWYALFTFPDGLLLAYVYLVCQQRKGETSFWMAAAVHSLHNLLASGLDALGAT